MEKNNVPTLETERLILRMWSRKDAEALYNYAKNPNVGPHAGWKPHESVAESRLVIKTLFFPNMVWAMVDKETGSIIGSIGLDLDSIRPDVASKELGYSLDESYWGRGLMTEAAKRLICYAFEELKLTVLMIRTSDSNRRSQRIIEKCGFFYEGTFRRAYKTYDGGVREMRCYSMLREEYERQLANLT
ncbi:MAG: GNAT family N-acetyltransferase [Clostridiales bacterium]|nr:GNAT family N-acetyltransferase [Clostridiales bacterium]